jgi:hypothetical protein
MAAENSVIFGGPLTRPPKIMFLKPPVVFLSGLSFFLARFSIARAAPPVADLCAAPPPSSPPGCAARAPHPAAPSRPPWGAAPPARCPAHAAAKASRRHDAKPRRRAGHPKQRRPRPADAPRASPDAPLRYFFRIFGDLLLNCRRNLLIFAIVFVD